MSKALRKSYAWGLSGMLSIFVLTAPAARAEVSSDVSGSILVFPKVVWDGTRDTIIQITNTSNQMVHAHCFWVNAALRNPNAPPGPTNPRLWQETDFFIWLTRQQPTHWVASQGRFVDPTDGFNNDGSGIDPGAVPPVPQGFEGELKCVQVTASGEPMGGNSLKGEATLRRDDGDVSKYNAVAILATGLISDNNQIRLDNPISPDAEGEANSCPNALLLNHFVDGTDSIGVSSVNEARCDTGNGCVVDTSITLVPCTQDFENQIPGIVTVQFEITDEFEVAFSASTTVECWLNIDLDDIASVFTVVGSGGSTGAMFTKIRPVDLHGGLIGIAEETHSDESGFTTVAAWNLQGDGQLPDGSNNFINGRFFPVSRFEATQSIPGGPVVDVITIPDF